MEKKKEEKADKEEERPAEVAGRQLEDRLPLSEKSQETSLSSLKTVGLCASSEQRAFVYLQTPAHIPSPGKPGVVRCVNPLYKHTGSSSGITPGSILPSYTFLS